MCILKQINRRLIFNYLRNRDFNTFTSLFLFCDCSNTFMKRKRCLTRHQNKKVKSRLKKKQWEKLLFLAVVVYWVINAAEFMQFWKKILQKTKYCRFKYLNYKDFIFNELLPKQTAHYLKSKC